VQPRLEKRGHQECGDESSGPVALPLMQTSDASGLGTDGKIYWIAHPNASSQSSLFTFYEVASCNGSFYMYLQCFDAVGWVTGRASIWPVRQLSCYADDSDLTRVEVPTATNAP